MESKDVIGFYDAFVEEQRRIGVNERVLGLYKRLRKAGLNSHSKVLELGCGIGTLTGLIARTVTTGPVEAVDISPGSIAYAKTTVKRANVTFHAHDVVGYSPATAVPDLVLLFDIIEHIPMERHAALFRHISSYCGPDTQVLVHIPSPGQVEYDQVHHPEALQVIDQALPLPHLVNVFNESGLELVHFETYGIWMKHDYQFFILRKARPYVPQSLAAERSFTQKVRKRLERAWSRNAIR